MAEYTITGLGAARMDIFVKLPDEEYDVNCAIDKHKCVIELGYGEKIPIKAVEYWVGGNSANVAVGAQRLGIPAQLVAELGDGFLANASHSQLEKEKIGMEWVTRTKGVPEGLGVVVNYEAERSILSYYSPHRPEFPKNLSKTEWAYLSSMGEGFESYYYSVLTWVRDNKVKLGFNPGGRQIKKGREWLSSFVRASEVLFVNREEGSKILGAPDAITDTKKLLMDLFDMGPKIVVVTDGPAGAYMYNGQVALFMPIIDSPVVERTGCGDSFACGFQSALMMGHDLETALKWGTVNAGSVVGKVGPQQGLLKSEELPEWMKMTEGLEIREL